jgi:hypothetical protein
VSALNKRWEEVISLAREQDERLQKQLNSSQDIYDQLETTTQWLLALKQDLAHKDYSVHDPADLQAKCTKFKVSVKKKFIMERSAEY